MRIDTHRILTRISHAKPTLCCIKIEFAAADKAMLAAEIIWTFDQERERDDIFF